LVAAENTHSIEDDLDQADLQALADALPGKKIDFSKEIEMDSPVSEPISPTIKEVLGDNFDFQALEQQIQESTESVEQTADGMEQTADGRQQTAECDEPLPSASEVDTAVYPVDVPLDVREDESGTVQVSSPFMLDVSSPFATGFSVPQTVFPTFSNDLLQESRSTAELMTGDITQFCFSEESQPMFTRKRKSN